MPRLQGSGDLAAEDVGEDLCSGGVAYRSDGEKHNVLAW